MIRSSNDESIMINYSEEQYFFGYNISKRSNIYRMVQVTCRYLSCCTKVNSKKWVYYFHLQYKRVQTLITLALSGVVKSTASIIAHQLMSFMINIITIVAQFKDLSNSGNFCSIIMTNSIDQIDKYLTQSNSSLRQVSQISLQNHNTGSSQSWSVIVLGAVSVISFRFYKYLKKYVKLQLPDNFDVDNI